MGQQRRLADDRAASIVGKIEEKRKVTAIMARKKKRSTAQRSTKSERTAPKPKKRSKYIFLALAVGIALLITGAYFLSQREKLPKPSPERAKLEKESVSLRENRPTL